MKNPFKRGKETIEERALKGLPEQNRASIEREMAERKEQEKKQTIETIRRIMDFISQQKQSAGEKLLAATVEKDTRRKIELERDYLRAERADKLFRNGRAIKKRGNLRVIEPEVRGLLLGKTEREKQLQKQFDSLESTFRSSGGRGPGPSEFLYKSRQISNQLAAEEEKRAQREQWAKFLENTEVTKADIARASAIESPAEAEAVQHDRPEEDTGPTLEEAEQRLGEAYGEEAPGPGKEEES